MPPIQILQIAYGSEDYWQTLRLRDLYLRKPLGLEFSSEDLQQDSNACHVVAKLDQQVIGCVIGIDEGSRVKLRQMLVSPTYQRQGIGRQLLEWIETMMVGQGKVEFYLHARLPSIDFYRKSGYFPVGEQFLEVGIWHQCMEKSMKKSGKA
jgi:N-acetylglutamate synthase-like GNAT family acetyltransferase